MYVDSARWENLSVEAKGDYFVLWSRQWFKFFYIKTVTGHALKNKNQQRRSRITDWTYTDCFWCKMTKVQSAWLLCAGWSVVLHSNWLLRCCLVAHDPGLFWGDWYHLVLWQVLFTLSYKKRMHFKRPAATYKKFKHLCVLWRCFPNKISTGVQCVLERRIVLDVLHNVLVISDASLDTWQLANMNFVFVKPGAKRLARDIRDMTGSAPNIFFIACWYIISPILIFVSFLPTCFFI